MESDYMGKDGFKLEVSRLLDEADEAHFKREYRELGVRVATVIVALLIWEGGQWWASARVGGEAVYQPANHVTVQSSSLRRFDHNIDKMLSCLPAEGYPAGGSEVLKRF